MKHDYVYLPSMTVKKRAHKNKTGRRKGMPFTLYLRPVQAHRLRHLSRSRHVAKSELVRMAIDRFLADVEKNGSTESLGLGS